MNGKCKEMEDRRIVKTKKNIKATLISMLDDMSFEKITVAELCRRGEMSRITFYTHYDDKYELIKEMYNDYLQEAYDIYHDLQGKNNEKQDSLLGYKNLLTCVLDMFYKNFDFFKHTSAEENPYLFTNFFNYVFESVDDYLVRHTGIVSQYPPKQTAAFLCNGLFGVINTCNYEGMKEKEVREVAESIYEIMLTSKLFRKNHV